MSTKPDTAKMAALGRRFRTAYLLQQAGYTLGLAQAEGPTLAALLPGGYVDMVVKLRDDVQKAQEDRTVHAADAKQASDTEQQTMHAATIWARKVGKRSQSAQHLGIGVPAELTRQSSPSTVPGMLDRLSKTLALLSEQAAAMDTALPATRPLIEEGRNLYQALQQADGTQEHARGADLPSTVADFLAKKGQLYTAKISAQRPKISAQKPEISTPRTEISTHSDKDQRPKANALRARDKDLDTQGRRSACRGKSTARRGRSTARRARSTPPRGKSTACWNSSTAQPRSTNWPTSLASGGGTIPAGG